MAPATQSALGKLLVFLQTLETENIHYRLGHVRDALMVEVAVPGERWEIKFFDNGEIEIERFVSSGVQEVSETELTQLISEYTT